MTVRNAASIVGRLLPGLLILPVLFVLGHVNKTAEVYLDLSTTAIAFTTSDETRDAALRIRADSIQLYDAELRTRNAVVTAFDDRSPQTVTPFVVGRRDVGRDSHISLHSTGGVVISALTIPVGARIAVAAYQNNTVELRIEVDSQAPIELGGVITVGDVVSLAGRNIQIGELGFPPDYQAVDVALGRLSRSVAFTPLDTSFVLTIYASTEPESVHLFEDMFVSQLTFMTLDLTKRVHRERSEILKGTVQIAGTDLFGKRFFLHEEAIDSAAFVIIPADADRYYVSTVNHTGDALWASLSSDAATEVAVGKRLALTRSVTPSVLDVMVQEPSKRTLWTVLTFLVTQLALLRGVVRGLSVHRGRDKRNRKSGREDVTGARDVPSASGRIHGRSS